MPREKSCVRRGPRVHALRPCMRSAHVAAAAHKDEGRNTKECIDGVGERRVPSPAVEDDRSLRKAYGALDETNSVNTHGYTGTVTVDRT